MTETHIKIPAIDPFVTYVANGIQTVFPYNFPVFSNSDMRVTLAHTILETGYTVSGAGLTEGGTVIFDTAPDTGVIVTLERVLTPARTTDFLQGGDLSARALNNEFDYIMACLQQTNHDQKSMLRFDPQEDGINCDIPAQQTRANKVLGFDGAGQLAMYQTGSSLQAQTFNQTGTGAITRALTDKARDIVSVKDFGAVGDGVTNDRNAFDMALAAHSAVFVPSGTYYINGTLVLKDKQSLFGVGQSSVIVASNTSFPVIEMRAGYARVHDIRVEKGSVGIKLYGNLGVCTQNSVSNVVIVDSTIGIVLDGYNDVAKPCAFNRLERIQIIGPTLHGIHLTRSSGAVPSGNSFHGVRVYSLGRTITGYGVYVEQGDQGNSFIDCSVNIGGTALACFCVGANATRTYLHNIVTDSTNTVPNIKLLSGSTNTVIAHLNARSNGSVIDDATGGAYIALNAGSSILNKVDRTQVSDLTANVLRVTNGVITTAGTSDLLATRSAHMADASAGAMTLKLPQASSLQGAMYWIKKTDSSANTVTVAVQTGDTIDSATTFALTTQNQAVTVISNGTKWLVLGKYL